MIYLLIFQEIFRVFNILWYLHNHWNISNFRSREIFSEFEDYNLTCEYVNIHHMCQMAMRMTTYITCARWLCVCQHTSHVSDGLWVCQYTKKIVRWSTRKIKKIKERVTNLRILICWVQLFTVNSTTALIIIIIMHTVHAPTRTLHSYIHMVELTTFI